jgi:capsule polysaccharide export protein KpsE/RkpR
MLAINNKVVCDVDKKNMVITISVTDQDPDIAALIADSVKERLQKFITDYRTKKARHTLEYSKKLLSESKSRYEKARRLYAETADANQDIILESVRTKLTDLENDMQLQFNAYSSFATQVQTAEAKVMEDTPAFTTLQSATVPLHKAGPKRAQKVIIFVLAAFLLTTAWILYREDDLKQLLGMG